MRLPRPRTPLPRTARSSHSPGVIASSRQPEQGADAGGSAVSYDGEHRRSTARQALLGLAVLTAAAGVACGTLGRALQPAAPSATAARVRLASSVTPSPTATAVATATSAEPTPAPTAAPATTPEPFGTPHPSWWLPVPKSRPTPEATLPPEARARINAGSLPPEPTSPRPQDCGDWASTSHPVGGAIAQKYGEIRNCALVGTTWVITTTGRLPSQHGVIATYECVDQACLDGRNDHPLANWHYFVSPNAAGVKLVGVDAANHRILVANNGEFWFDLQTKAFTLATSSP